MMKSNTLRLVLLVSCCHALVHVYELSFASVEQLIVADKAFGIEASVPANADAKESAEAVAARRKEISGYLGNCLRLPFGLCALAAGWLADRLGAKRLLLVYLAGCSAAALLAWFAPTLALLFVSMFTLGTFASIYHPAGVGLITHHTNPDNRPMALGYHGILGSVGIAAGPFLAGAVLATGASWRTYYLVLTIPGLLLAGLLAMRLTPPQDAGRGSPGQAPAAQGDDNEHWFSFFTLMVLTSLAGFVYAALLNFMPRYLDTTGLHVAGISERSLRNYLTGMVLLLGVIGQYTAGRIARPTTLEPLMAFALFAAASCVLWMGYAQGTTRLWAAALWAPLFFMQQPLFNSTVAKYVPRRRRSLCYGLSFTLGFGVGSFGPTFAGQFRDDVRLEAIVLHAVLAGILCVAATLALVLWRWHRPLRPGELPLEPLADEEALA
jgi:FSR family fosmidomycin resistance protein-like MFS transporter